MDTVLPIRDREEPVNMGRIFNDCGGRLLKRGLDAIGSRHMQAGPCPCVAGSGRRRGRTKRGESSWRKLVFSRKERVRGKEAKVIF